MNAVLDDFQQLLHEHRVLLRHLGETQQRCSRLIRAQAAEIERLQGQAVRLHAAAIVKASALAWAPPDRHTLQAALPEGDAESDDLDALEASLVAADLVICQTGCVSHGAYWRVRDHCRRTGKTCVLAERPETLRIVRIATAGTGEAR